MNDYFSLYEGGPVYKGAEGVFPIGTDSVLLADFAKTPGVRRVMDLGCGGGILLLLLLGKNADIEVHGADISPAAVECCIANLRQNGHLSEGIINADMRKLRTFYPSGHFDMLISNPPYFSRESGRISPDEARARARSEGSATLAELIESAAYLCKTGGYFYMVIRSERMTESMHLMTKCGLEPKRLRLVAHKVDSAPRLVLIEAKRGAKPSVKVEPLLILENEDGTPTAEYRRIYHLEV